MGYTDTCEGNLVQGSSDRCGACSVTALRFQLSSNVTREQRLRIVTYVVTLFLAGDMGRVGLEVLMSVCPSVRVSVINFFQGLS